MIGRGGRAAEQAAADQEAQGERDQGTAATHRVAVEQPLHVVGSGAAGTLQTRADDTYEAVSKRLNVYETQTKPLLRDFANMGVLRVIQCGTGTPDALHKLVCRVLLHELRKEVGSIIANEQGIFEASRYLRHSDVRITSQIYVDKKKKITPGLGALL